MPSLLVLAQASSGGLQGLLTLAPMVFIFVIFYLVWFLPLRKKQKEHDALLDQLKKGDKVITASGFYGEVAKVDGDVVVLKLNENTPVRVSKRAITELERTPAADDKR